MNTVSASEKPLKELLRFSIINLDKPRGPTSFDVAQYVKELAGVNKTSHFGTLDPSVSGVLPMALGRACRLARYFLSKEKTYVGIMRLHEDVELKKLEAHITQFIGTISQLPPVRSNVKRAVRERDVFSFELLEQKGKDILFKTRVEAGTYIRKLIHDIGADIGGAHMLELRRTAAGIFDEKESVTLYQLEEAINEYKKGNEKLLRAILIPAEIVGEVLPVVQLKKQAVSVCLRGSPLFKRFLQKETAVKEDYFCAFSGKQLIGCYRTVREGEVVGVPEFVFN